jgi:enoyl-CoA hydratase/carnithine racemase
MSGLLVSDARDGVLRLTLDDPKSRNSLSEAMMAALQEALDNAAADPNIRAIVIAATGEVFCSGHNLKEITARRSDGDKGRSYFEQLLRQCAKLMLSIVRHPKPVIAEVQGLASAAGCQLVASADMAFASEAARFCTPGVNIGLFCSTPMVALSRNVARKHAMEMLLTGIPVSAADAYRMGLVNRVVSPNMLGETVAETVTLIASKSGKVLKIGKEAFYRQADMEIEEAYAYASQVMTENLLHRDAEEGISAFIEKRQPDWRNP